MLFTSTQVRILWTQFWESKWHKHALPVSLIAHAENKSVLFNVAGMQQFVPYLVGKPHPLGSRLYNIQKCIRTNDIDDIGDERHCSMFEMMGNWSLGEYFKSQAIGRSLEFLVDVLKIDKTKIWATIFAGDISSGIPRDDESYQTLVKSGVKHIKEIWFDKYGDSDNFWTPGPVWPCWPCVEFYYDRWDQFWPADRDLWVNDRYTEIRNNVMMEYYSSWELVNGHKYTPLSQKNVDTWMGFERLCMVLQDTETIFETDIFSSYSEIIASHTDTNYTDYSKSYRIIMDHMRAWVCLMCDGVVPSNEWRWYVLRRLIRRWYYNLIWLGNLKASNEHWNHQSKELIQVRSSCLHELVRVIIDNLWPYYDWMNWKIEEVSTMLIKECIHFDQTIAHWLSELEKYITSWSVSSEQAFKLFDSFGLPWDIINDVCANNHINIDKIWFDKEVEKAKEKSRNATSFVKNTEWSKYLSWVDETEFVWYNNFFISTNNGSWTIELISDFTTDQWQRVLVFNQTPFYATWWGQIGDSGLIILDSWERVRIKEVIKYAWVFLHLVA